MSDSFNYHGGEIYDKNISLDFSVNTNPLGMPPVVREALLSSIGSFELYPDIRSFAFCQAIAEAYGIANQDFIIPGNGASELIMAVVNAIYPKRGLTLAPTFSAYNRSFKAWSVRESFFYLDEQDNFLLNETILSSMKRMDMVFLCNPNNPTGRLIPGDLLTKIINHCEKNEIFLVIDESFLELSDTNVSYSVMEKASRSEYVIGISSLTKTYSLAGLRAGFLVTANKEVLDRIREILPEWNLSMPAQIASITALSVRETYLKATHDLIKTEREFLSESLKEKGYVVFPSETNFLLFKTEENLYESLLAKDILIRECSNFNGLGSWFFRTCVSTHERNSALLNSI